MYEEEYMEYNDRGGGPNPSTIFKLISILLGIVFLPSLIIAFVLYYILFRKARFKPYISGVILFIITIISYLVLNGVGLISGMGIINNIMTPNVSKIASYLSYCVIASPLIAFVIILVRAFQLKRSPELRHMKGWAYQFEYAETPFDKLKREKVVKSLQLGNEYDSERAPIGVLDKAVRNRELEDDANTKAEPNIVYRYYDEAVLHTVLTGATGAGKTATMLALAKNDIMSGYPVCVVDFKKSPDVIYFLSKWAEENNRKFYHFTSGKPGEYRNPYLKNQSTYDPLATGSATSKADMVLNLRTWDTASEVFKNRTQDILQSTFFLLERTPHHLVPDIEWDKGGLAQIISALDVNNLRRMIEVMVDEAEAGKLSESDLRRLNTLTSFHQELEGKRNTGLKEQVNELLSICRTLVVSSYGDWLEKGDPDNHIDLMEISMSEEAPVVLFSFNPQEEAEFARYMGNIVMSDLNRVSAEKNKLGNKNRFGVYLDEFQTLDPLVVSGLLEKSRSAYFFITLSVQSLEQIVQASNRDGEAGLKAIIDTCGNFIFHSGASYDSGERMSKIIGKVDKYVYRTSSRMSSGAFNLDIFNRRKAMVSKDIVNEWLVDPSEFLSLQKPLKSNGFKATAFLVNKTTSDSQYEQVGALGRRVHIVVEDEIVEGMPDDFRDKINLPKFVEAIPERVEELNNVVPEDEANDYEGGWSFEIIEEDEGASSKGTDVLPDIPRNDDSAKELTKKFDREPKLTSFEKIKAEKEVKKNDESNKHQLPKLPKLPGMK